MRARLGGLWQRRAVRLTVISFLSVFAFLALWTGTGHAVNFPQFTICGPSGNCADVDSTGSLKTTGSGGGGGNVVITAPTDASGHVLVNTAAPCATPTCNDVVWQGTSPWVVTTAVPVPVVSPGLYQGVTQVCPSTAPAPVNNVYIWTCDSSGFANVNVKALPNVLPSPLSTIPVTTPAPAATLATYLAPYAVLVCPSTAPAASNSTYTCTIDSSGFQNVNVKNTPVPAPSTTATNMAATPAPVTTPGTPVVLYQAMFTNSDTATVYCGVYDSATSPTLGTTVPKFLVAVPAGQTMPVFSGPTNGTKMATGIYGGCATTYLGSTPETAGKVFFTAIWGA